MEHRADGGPRVADSNNERALDSSVAGPQPEAEREVPQGLAAAPLLGRARTLVLWAMIAAVLYSTLVSSKGGCPGGFSTDGGFVDGSGNPTTVQPQCVQLVLQPSPMVYLVIALTVIIALARAARAVEVAAAMRTMKRAAFAAVGIAVVSMVIAVVWFLGIPMPATDGTVIFPFPFGGGTMTVTPMEPGPTSG